MATKIFRYKLSDDIMTNITQFAKIHQLDDRHQYKEAWTRWLAAEEESVEREVLRLQQLNYKGDVIDKMFKAGRYYFRGKEEAAAAAVTTKEKKKRDYIVMHPDIIQAMDRHLRGLIHLPDFKPAVAYDQFCCEHVELLRTEIRRFVMEYDGITGKKMSAKFKKTYKNRYFTLSL
jgi:hypothetical protein